MSLEPGCPIFDVFGCGNQCWLDRVARVDHMVNVTSEGYLLSFLLPFEDKQVVYFTRNRPTVSGIVRQRRFELYRSELYAVTLPAGHDGTCETLGLLL